MTDGTKKTIDYIDTWRHVISEHVGPLRCDIGRHPGEGRTDISEGTTGEGNPEGRFTNKTDFSGYIATSKKKEHNFETFRKWHKNKTNPGINIPLD